MMLTQCLLTDTELSANRQTFVVVLLRAVTKAKKQGFFVVYERREGARILLNNHAPLGTS